MAAAKKKRKVTKRKAAPRKRAKAKKRAEPTPEQVKHLDGLSVELGQDVPRTIREQDFEQEKIHEAVLRGSVYGALVVGDKTVQQVVEFFVNRVPVRRKDGSVERVLRWQPPWAHVEHVVTVESVMRAAQRLAQEGWIQLRGDLLTVPNRFSVPGGHRAAPPFKLTRDRKEMCTPGDPRAAP